LKDDFSDKRRNHPARPGDRSDVITIPLEARSRAEVVEPPKCHGRRSLIQASAKMRSPKPKAQPKMVATAMREVIERLVLEISRGRTPGVVDPQLSTKLNLQIAPELAV
jgi:hypothetical protein